MHDYDQEKIRRKSTILTNHSQFKPHSSSVPTLPSLQPNQPVKSSNNIKVYSIKTRQELLKEDRFRNLLKLKINLNDLHIQELEFRQKMRPKKERDANMAERMEVRLNQIMAMDTQHTSEKKMERDLEEIEFIQCCDSLLHVCTIIRKEGNYHFKNKIANFTYSMKHETEILELFQKLLNDVPIKQLYKKYKRLIQQSFIFKKELKALAIQARQIVQVYKKSRYKFLNADIVRRSNKMAAEGKSIGDRLNQVQNWKMRKRLYGSLQKMQFECMANRNLYEELTERVKSIEF